MNEPLHLSCGDKTVGDFAKLTIDHLHANRPAVHAKLKFRASTPRPLSCQDRTIAISSRLVPFSSPLFQVAMKIACIGAGYVGGEYALRLGSRCAVNRCKQRENAHYGGW